MVQMEEPLDRACLAKDGLSASSSKYIISCPKPKQKKHTHPYYTPRYIHPILVSINSLGTFF
jgi:hypothetical protein